MTEWRDIGSAPRDRRFLGFRPPENDAFDFYMISVCKYREAENGRSYIYSEADYDGLPYHNWTHWQPLPVPPELDKTGEG